MKRPGVQIPQPPLPKHGFNSVYFLDNLRLVCGNCDMQLPTYKSKNKNSDRRKGRLIKLELLDEKS